MLKWMKYQMETALQLIEAHSADPNEARLKELEKQLKSGMLFNLPGIEMAASKNRPQA